MDNTLRQWEGNNAWRVISNLKEKHNCDFQLKNNEWSFFQNKILQKKATFIENEPVCWQVYHLFFSSL